jgi:hypothetical protein
MARQKAPHSEKQRQQISALGKAHGGKIEGSAPKPGAISTVERQALRRLRAEEALEAAKKLGEDRYKLAQDVPPEAAALAQFARMRIVEAASSRVSSRRGPTVMKACTALLDEIRGPIAQEVNANLNHSFASIVARATTKATQTAAAQATVLLPLPAKEE